MHSPVPMPCCCLRVVTPCTCATTSTNHPNRQNRPHQLPCTLQHTTQPQKSSAQVRGQPHQVQRLRGQGAARDAHPQEPDHAAHPAAPHQGAVRRRPGAAATVGCLRAKRVLGLRVPEWRRGISDCLPHFTCLLMVSLWQSYVLVWDCCITAAAADVPPCSPWRHTFCFATQAAAVAGPASVGHNDGSTVDHTTITHPRSTVILRKDAFDVREMDFYEALYTQSQAQVRPCAVRQ